MRTAVRQFRTLVTGALLTAGATMALGFTASGDASGQGAGSCAAPAVTVASTAVGPSAGTLSGTVTGGVVTVTFGAGTFSSSGTLVLCTFPLSGLNSDPSNPTIGFFALDVPGPSVLAQPLHITLVDSELTPKSFLEVQGGDPGRQVTANFQQSSGQLSFDAYEIFEYAVLAHRPGTTPMATMPTIAPRTIRHVDHVLPPGSAGHRGGVTGTVSHHSISESPRNSGASAQPSVASPAQAVTARPRFTG